MLEDYSSVVPDHISVPIEIGDLILSYVANNIGERVGLDTVTDQQLAFAINALDGLGIRAEGELRGALLSTIMKVQIPYRVSALDEDTYVELRDRYAPVRSGLKRTVASISNTARLSSTSNPEYLQRHILAEALAFHEECKKLRAERWMRRFRNYVPIAVGGLISIIAASLGVQELSIRASAAGLAINVIREQIKADPLTEPQRIQRMVADLRAEIIDKSLISALT